MTGGDTGHASDPGRAPRLFHVLGREAEHVRATPYGLVGTVYTGPALEVIWVTKQDEDIDPGWFSQPSTDILFVVQGQLRVEFADGELDDVVMTPGDLLIVPPGVRCRAYRWPRDAREATVFMAAYSPDRAGNAAAGQEWVTGRPKVTSGPAQGPWPLWG